MSETLKRHLPAQEKDRLTLDSQMQSSDGKFRFLEQKMRDIDQQLQGRLMEHKREFDSLKQPVWDQV
jgi:hypothetical protein